MEQPTLAERLFWPAICLAVLGLGGVGMIGHKIVSRHSAPAAIAAAKAPARTTKSSEAVPPDEMNAAPALEAPSPSESESELPAAAEAPQAVLAAAPASAMDEDSPYVVPAGKPFISRETFAPPPKPKAPKKAAVAAPKTPPAVKPPARAPATAKSDAKKNSSPPPAIGIPKTPVYIMRDGRKIPAIKVVDLGDSYGLKSASGQIITVLKADVSEIQK